MHVNVEELLAQGEGLRLEFKRTVPAASRMARTLAAFANTSGGRLLVGVSDDRRVLGVTSEEREMQRIERVTDFLVDPPLAVSYTAVVVDGKKVLVVDVAESEDKPHYAVDEHGKRTVYVRQRDKSVPTNRHLLPTAKPADPAWQQLWQSPTVRALRQFLRKNDTLTAARLAKLVNVSEGRADKLLRQLVEQGLLSASGSAKATRYALRLE